MGLIDFQERKRFNRIVFSIPVVLVLFGLTLWMLWGSMQAWSARHALIKKNEAIAVEIEELEMNTKKLEKRLAVLASPRGLDLEARERFNLKEPGEHAVMFVGEGATNNYVPPEDLFSIIIRFIQRFPIPSNLKQK
jgi:cell division protein FtsB